MEFAPGGGAILGLCRLSSYGHDRKTKFGVYARAGVREYWIVDPVARTIDVNVLRGQAYALVPAFGVTERVRSEVLPGLEIVVGDVCAA